MTRLPDGPILQPERNCWLTKHADQLGLIVDAASYFKAVKEVMLGAKYTIYLIGWDFDTRIKFEPEEKTLDGPNTLGPFLRWLAKMRPGLVIHVLKWDLGALQTLARGTTPLAILDWTTNRRIRFKLDGAHPKGATHHQKIVVVDDAIAFCGGIDMTTDRWDTREHRDHDERRKRPSGRAYGPWHDATTIVDGEVARALGELARERWRRATDEQLTPPPRSVACWPTDIQPAFRDIDVGIARTMPQYGDNEAVEEIRAFYLDAIAAATRFIYCESQYFACRRVAEALARRLREKDGPDIVVINPESADGYLEAKAMDTARARLLTLLRKADQYERLRFLTPVTRGRNPIYVHAKILIVDDRLLRVGSSNLNNRSMGFDTECDLIIEAVPCRTGLSKVQEGITATLHDLLAEHLDVPAEAVAQMLSETKGLLSTAIDALIGEGRSLTHYEPREASQVEEVLAENDLLDPERPPSWTRLLLKSLPFGNSCLR